jgi:hypothetical protein
VSTRQVERHCSEVCDAIMRASASGDSSEIAFSMVTMATTVIGTDQLARTALARLMMKVAHDLDGDIVSATLQ